MLEHLRKWGPAMRLGHAKPESSNIVVIAFLRRALKDSLDPKVYPSGIVEHHAHYTALAAGGHALLADLLL